MRFKLKDTYAYGIKYRYQCHEVPTRSDFDGQRRKPIERPVLNEVFRSSSDGFASISTNETT